MKTRILLTFALLCAVALGAWAQTKVSTDSELRAAIQNNGANITVTADIDLSNSTLSIATGTTVTIDLGGHTLDRKLTKRGEGGGQVITVRKGATLNLSNGTLKGGWGRDGGGLVNEEGTVTLTNVNITGNTADDRGGGISNHGTLTMTGGSITGNTTNDQTDPKGGGGIMNTEGATATLTGVTITGNTVNVTGGGGICNYGMMTLDGCTITGNSCKMNGGGIWTAASATLNMQGAITVTGNTTDGEVANNLFLKSNAVVTITGSLAGSDIGITMQKAGVFTSGYNANNSGVDPATIFTPDLSGVMAISLDGNEAKLASILPEGTVYYIERSWDEENRVVKAEVRFLQAGQYTVLNQDNNNQSSPTSIQPGYYVINKDVTIHNLRTEGDGAHHLILCDGATLTTMHINVEGQNSLYIYGQIQGSGTIKSYQYAMVGFAAAIGGGNKKTNGPIYIHGGTINVNANKSAAGIGGGRSADGGIVTIYGGDIRAEGGDTADESLPCGAGIGGGGGPNASTKGGAGGTVTIYGGHVEAYGGNSGGTGIGGGDDGNGGDIAIHGGYVKAVGDNFGAGIGSGDNYNRHVTSAGKLLVTGGVVYAYGGGRAAGIGGGRNSSGADVTISGGYVYAQAGKYAAGIGSGMEEVMDGGKQGGKLTVTGGRVYAYGGEDGAGIGGGEDADGATVTISGGYVYAEGNYWGAGIGGGEEGDGGKVTITGGTVIAKAGRDETSCSAIGSGYDCDVNGSLTLGDDRCVYITGNLWRSKKENRVSDCWGAMYVQISECLHGDATATVVNGDKHSISNCKWCYTTGEEAHTFGDDSQCDACQLIRLEDEGDNSALFTRWADGNAHDFFLSGRKLVPALPAPEGEGSGVGSSRAYTVCLPFSMDLTDRAADVTLWTLSYIKDGSEMVFTRVLEKKVEAGKPYLVVIHKGELELLGHSPLTVKADEGVRVYDWDNREQPLGWWRGTMTKIESADAAAVMAYALQSVGDFRRIRPDTYWAWWGAFRSMYCPDELPGTNRFTINRGALGGFGSTVSFEGDADIDGDVVGISLTPEGWHGACPYKGEGSIYTLSGVKLDGVGAGPVPARLRKGIYIVGGKKVVIP